MLQPWWFTTNCAWHHVSGLLRLYRVAVLRRVGCILLSSVNVGMCRVFIRTAPTLRRNCINSYCELSQWPASHNHTSHVHRCPKDGEDDQHHVRSSSDNKRDTDPIVCHIALGGAYMFCIAIPHSTNRLGALCLFVPYIFYTLNNVRLCHGKTIYNSYKTFHGIQFSMVCRSREPTCSGSIVRIVHHELLASYRNYYTTPLHILHYPPEFDDAAVVAGYNLFVFLVVGGYYRLPRLPSLTKPDPTVPGHAIPSLPCPAKSYRTMPYRALACLPYHATPDQASSRPACHTLPCQSAPIRALPA